MTRFGALQCTKKVRHVSLWGAVQKGIPWFLPQLSPGCAHPCHVLSRLMLFIGTGLLDELIFGQYRIF